MVASTIGHKIGKVCDCLCKLCVQCFDFECRAYQQPHSDKEFVARNGRGTREDQRGLCMLSVFRWAYGPGSCGTTHRPMTKDGAEALHEPS